MRLILPARMSPSAQNDARTIAEAVGRALHQSKSQERSMSVQIPGQGEPATFISQRVFREIRRLPQTRKTED